MNKSEAFRERSEGHEDLWQGTPEEFMDLVTPVIRAEQLVHSIPKKVVILACKFLRLGYDQHELKGTVAYEVSTAIDQALVYFTNVLGEDV
jgi:hypothetical protein